MNELDELILLLSNYNNSSCMNWNDEFKNSKLIINMKNKIISKCKLHNLNTNDNNNIDDDNVNVVANAISQSKVFKKIRKKLKNQLNSQIDVILNNNNNNKSNRERENSIEILWSESGKTDDQSILNNNNNNSEDVITVEKLITHNNNVNSTISSTSGSCDEYSLLSFSTLPSYDQIQTLAQTLRRKKLSSKKRHETLKQLLEFQSSDLLIPSSWQTVKCALQCCAFDKQSEVVRHMALEAYINLYNTCINKKLCIELYASLIYGLINENMSIHFNCYDHVRVIHYFQCQIPLIWSHLSEKLCKLIIDDTMKFLVSSRFTIHLSQIDPIAQWMHIWCMRASIRQFIINEYLNKNEYYSIISNILNDIDMKRVNILSHQISLIAQWMRYNEFRRILTSNDLKLYIQLCTQLLLNETLNNVPWKKIVFESICEMVSCWHPKTFLYPNHIEQLLLWKCLHNTFEKIGFTSSYDITHRYIIDICFCWLSFDDMINNNNNDNEIITNESNNEKIIYQFINYIYNCIQLPKISQYTASNILCTLDVIKIILKLFPSFILNTLNCLQHIIENLMNDYEYSIILLENKKILFNHQRSNNYMWQNISLYAREHTQLSLNIIDTLRNSQNMPIRSLECKDSLVFHHELQFLMYQIITLDVNLIENLYNNNEDILVYLFTTLCQLYREHERYFDINSLNIILTLIDGPKCALYCGFVDDIIEKLRFLLSTCSIGYEPPMEINMTLIKRIEDTIKILKIIYTSKYIIENLDFKNQQNITLWYYLEKLLCKVLPIFGNVYETYVNDEVLQMGYEFLLELLCKIPEYILYFNQRLNMYEYLLNEHSEQNDNLQNALNHPKWYDSISAYREKVLKLISSENYT